VPLTGAPVRFDYTSIDPTMHTLWISPRDAGQLLASNVVRREITRTISAPGLHCVIAVPEIGRVYASATNAGEVLTINSRTGALQQRPRTAR
jgi:hypothetical protein